MSTSKSYSLNTKITFSFIALGFILLSILFIQIIPNMQEEQKKYKTNEIVHMIALTKEQVKLAIELFTHSRVSRFEKIEAKLAHTIIKNTENSKVNFKSIISESKCEAYFLEDKKTKLSSAVLDLLKEDGLKTYMEEQTHMCPKRIKKIFFIKTLSNKKRVVIDCNPQRFVDEHTNLEERVKKDLEKSFDITYKDHKGKINIIWLNTKHKDFSTKPLYNLEDNTYNEKYCVSKMSSALLPQTGKLTGKTILQSSEKKPIRHKLNTKEDQELYDQEAITWVRTIQDLGNIKIMFLTTIYEKDFNRDLYDPVFKVLPAAILAISVAIIFGIFLFRRLFKSINILTNTASEVNKGNLNLRSDIQGNDDIAVLGKTFDNMLDSIEENIKNLDKKVEEKTSELSTSLEEKEVLLKEVHHRVKNNLAMTINLIKLQKSKIDDKKTKDVLVDIQERIFTMELLHRKLYESKDLSSISFKKYVCELSEDLFLTYGKSRDININCQIEDINMSIEHALPCGLIITECLTNAYKYAFEKDKGNINISLIQNSNRYTLIISDDGVGLPKDIDINKAKTLGLRLISSIVRGQLLGTFDYVYKNGSKFYINFRL